MEVIIFGNANDGHQLRHLEQMLPGFIIITDFHGDEMAVCWKIANC